MNKQKLTILHVVPRSGISAKTGKPWEIHAAQCVLEQETSDGKQILVGQINLPRELKDSQPGEYLAEFGLQQSMDGRLEARIVSLVPFGMPKAKAAAGTAVA
jgi:hypothetical protein